MQFFDYIKILYQKNKIEIDINTSLCITITKWLSYDKDNLPFLKKIIPFFYYIEPLHYFYLLFFNIPKKQYVPLLKKIERTNKKKDNLLCTRIQETLQWTKKELEFNMSILEQVILNNSKFWKEELGVK